MLDDLETYELFHGYWPKIEHLRAHLAAFDKIYFGGMLSDHIALYVVDGKTPLSHGDFVPDDWTLGHTIFDNHRSEDTSKNPSLGSYISNLIRDHAHLQLRNSPTDRRGHILATLLHEMAHAFLMSYGCSGRAHQEFDAVKGAIGFTGHGPCWVNVVKALISHANRFLAPFWAAPATYAWGVDYSEELEVQERHRLQGERVERWFAEQKLWLPEPRKR